MRLKKSTMILLGSWIVMFPVLGFAPNFIFFVFFTILMGFLFVSTWTLTRAVMTTLCPKEKLNFGFSFYTLAERVSTFIGPLAWGLVTLFFYGWGPIRYRIGIVTMAVFIVAGFFFMNKVQIREKTNPFSR